MEIESVQKVTVDIKTLKIHCKVCDQFTAGLYDANGKLIKDYEGYVPEFMPGHHYGDYIILDIDIETGQITNWEKIKPEQIEEFINE